MKNMAWMIIMTLASCAAVFAGAPGISGTSKETGRIAADDPRWQGEDPYVIDRTLGQIPPTFAGAAGNRVTVPAIRGGGTNRHGMTSRAGTGWWDDFNRPDGSDMGPDWTEIDGDFEIADDRGHTLANFSWMRHASASAPYFEQVQGINFSKSDDGLAYVALICGWGTDSIFIKVQDNDSDGYYDRVFFYHGNSGGSWGQPDFYFDLATPTASGRMYVYFTNGGDTANLDIDSDLDGVMDEHFESNGILAAGLDLGTGFGIGGYGNSCFDNWEIGGQSPRLEVEDAFSGKPMSMTVTGAEPNETVYFLYSLTRGDIYIPQFDTSLQLGLPIHVAATGTADASGACTVTVDVSRNSTGMTAYLQGLTETSGGTLAPKGSEMIEVFPGYNYHGYQFVVLSIDNDATEDGSSINVQFWDLDTNPTLDITVVTTDGMRDDEIRDQLESQIDALPDFSAIPVGDTTLLVLNGSGTTLGPEQADEVIIESTDPHVKVGYGAYRKGNTSPYRKGMVIVDWDGLDTVGPDLEYDDSGPRMNGGDLFTLKDDGTVYRVKESTWYTTTDGGVAGTMYEQMYPWKAQWSDFEYITHFGGCLIYQSNVYEGFTASSSVIGMDVLLVDDIL